MDVENEIKLCACGCGEPVKKNKKGKFNRFILYHAIRLNNPSKSESFKIRMTGENNPSKRPEVREKISKAVKGKNTGDSNHMKQEKYRKMFSEMWTGENNPMYGRKGEKHPNFGKPSPLRGSNIPEERKKRISEKHKGIPKSEEHNKKISETIIKNDLCKGENNPFYGKNHTEETRIILSEKATERFKIKENHPSWQGGISFEPYTIEFDNKLKQKIRKRDNNICQNPDCNKKIKNGDIHHINYIKKDCGENNLITLCKSCHTKTNKNRVYWEDFYKNIIELKNRES